jgi:hypothetical protein
MKTEYDDRFCDTLGRLLPETYNLMCVQAALEALADHSAGAILAQSFSALRTDRLVRLIRILEDSNQTATFWYLYNCEPANVAKDLDVVRLKNLSRKVKHVRDRTLFHIDKHSVSNSQAVYKQANIEPNEIIWAMETIWLILNRLYEQRFGHSHRLGHTTLDAMREVCQRDLENLRRKGILRKD